MPGQTEGGSIAATHSKNGKWKDVGGQHHTPAALLQVKIGTHCISGWIDMQILAPPGLDPRIFHPEASLYNDYDTSATIVIASEVKVSRERPMWPKGFRVD